MGPDPAVVLVPAALGLRRVVVLGHVVPRPGLDPDAEGRVEGLVVLDGLVGRVHEDQADVPALLQAALVELPLGPVLVALQLHELGAGDVLEHLVDVVGHLHRRLVRPELVVEQPPDEGVLLDLVGRDRRDGVMLHKNLRVSAHYYPMPVSLEPCGTPRGTRTPNPTVRSRAL